MTLLARARLLQLASQALPIGGYSHSSGLESAIDSGRVRDEAAVLQWIVDVLEYSIGSFELPMLQAMAEAWQRHDALLLAALNENFLAARESAELRGATLQMGYSMRQLLSALPNLPNFLTATLLQIEEPALPCVWSGLAAAWCIDAQDSALAYLWTWSENQVLVAIKTLPIGQSAGQRILTALGARIAMLSQRQPAEGQPLSNFAPGFAILSAQHESQYSRLFRS